MTEVVVFALDVVKQLTVEGRLWGVPLQVRGCGLATGFRQGVRGGSRNYGDRPVANQLEAFISFVNSRYNPIDRHQPIS